jgi:TonB-dependent starch-binding outer membrane protein SusC
MKRARLVIGALLAVLWMAPLGAQQPTGTIRGRVTDATQQPLSGVTVTVGSRDVRTQADGRYTMTDVPAGTYTVQARMLGYAQATQPVTVVGGQTVVVDLTLTGQAISLAGIVVTGYGESQKRDLTGVIEEVSAEQFNTGRIVSAEELIRGKVAGVQVAEANGGEPGGGMSIRIRGGTSITSSNEPLYVIDGVPMPVGGGLSAGRNPGNFLNPNDIESFTVLKDASATAIYGSQGANGVVLITTRSAKAGGAAGWGLSYRGTFSGSNVVARPSVLSADQFRTAVEDHAPQQVQYLGDSTTDWFKQVERTGFGQEHTVVVSGGAEKTSLRASLGYLSQEGVVRASKNQRLSLNLAFNQLLFNDRLSVQANLLGARNEDQFTPGGVLGAAANFAPTQPIYDSSSVYGGYFEWDNPLAGVNPVAQLNMISDHGTTYRSLGNVTGEYAVPFLEGLSATARVGYVATSSERRFFAPSNDKNQVNRGFYGTVSRSNPTELSTLFDGFLTYTKNSARHGLTLTGGYAYTQRRQDSPSFYAQNLSSNMLGPDGIPSAQLQQTSLFIDEAKLSSYFARANYTYQDKYLITGTVRRDGSSKFGPGNQWGTFPSAAVAWRISQESFMAGGGTFSDLKLRLSWGKNGNSAFPSYQQYKRYVLGDPQAEVQFGNEFVSTIRPSAADPNIKWEETSSWNLGLDYGLWNNRVSGALELYTKTTKDLIFDVIVAGGTNLSNVLTTNVGSMKNKGVELTLNALIAEGRGGGLSWDANFNVAYNKNELLQINPFAGGGEQILSGNTISGGVGTYIQVLQPGQPVNSFFLYHHKRDAAGTPIVGTDLEMYEDLDSNGVINQDDRAPFHSPAPAWIVGHTSQLRYGSFDLSFTLLAHLGNYVYNNVASSTGFYDQLTDAARPNNLHSSVLENNFDTPQYFSDVYLENASFLRMDNIELGYTFRRGLNGTRVFGVVQNAFTITGYSGIDPTARVDGIDNNIYPRSRTFTGGVSVAF